MRFPPVIAPLLVAVAPVAAEPVGPAIPVAPDAAPLVVTKLRVTDCRAVRGYVGAPIDGSTRSGSWDGKTWEYPMRNAGAGVGYNYLNGDGLHLTFADDVEGFNAVVVRGGIKARLLRDVRKYDDPDSGQIVHTFPGGGATTSRAWFDEPVRTRSVSFFDVSDGLIADTSFFRVTRGVAALEATVQPMPEGPLVEETSLTAIGVTFDAPRPATFTISVTDPLNPRLELHGADYAITGAGNVRIVCDVPDQVVPAGTKLAVSITPPIDNVRFELYQIPRERAITGALEHRKHILHALYTPVSEARPWNIWNEPGAEEKYFAQPADTGDVLQDRLRPWVREIIMTLDQCRVLDEGGNDEVVRQYHQWIRRKMITKSPEGMPPFPTKFQQIDGVPEWASLVHQAWMQSREVARWWIENRLAPNGEFGGHIADDTDLFQNFAPFPMLERDGVGGMVLNAGARMAELTDQLMLTDGMNRESMDPLHAYEEGLNHLALQAYWNYGDPVYLERCMAAARSTEPQTIITEKGHRHFRSNTLGVEQITKPAPLEREHGTHCLMWHPTLIVAWYNRNPLAMQWLTEWGGGWLDHMKPNDHAVAIKLPEDETTRSDPLPFQGGWGMTGSVFMFLADLTGDGRFIRPYTDYFRAHGKNTGIHYAEILQMAKMPIDARVSDPPWNWSLYVNNDKKPFIAAIKKDVEELQRFGHMYTTVECFTDRVFLYPIINPAIACTGGYTTRNKLNLNYAITYDGFGTDYAALVTAATKDELRVLLCNVSHKPITGQMRIWRLKPGVYHMWTGPEGGPRRRNKVLVSRGEAFTITLPPKAVQALAFEQFSVDEASPLDRADLALSPLELKVDGRSLRGVAHNIGSAAADRVIVSLLDADGKIIDTASLGALDAPLDLKPKTIPFEFDKLPDKAEGWSVMLDVEGAVSEIYEGNNRVYVR